MRIGVCGPAGSARAQLICWMEQYCEVYGCKPVIAPYTCVQELLSAMSLLRFDLVFLSLDGPEGFLSARKLREKSPEVKLVLLTDTPRYAVMGVRIHLTDYIVKPAQFKHVVRALKLAGVGRGG